MATSKQHSATTRHFFDNLVTRHAIILNPPLSVRGERYEAIEGKTPEITVDGARKLLAAIDTSTAVGLRDRAIVAILVYTAFRAGALAKIKCGAFIMRAISGCCISKRKAASPARSPFATIWSKSCSNTSTQSWPSRKSSSEKAGAPARPAGKFALG